jgi:DNA modification methylase
MKKKLNHITKKDCLKYLETIPDNSIDLIITDPPYFIGFDGGEGWDSQWKTERDYLKWCNHWTNHLVRVLKPNRMMIVWGTLKTDTFLKYKLMLSLFDELRSQNEIVWSYNWGGRTKNNFARKHEYAWCYSKGDNFLFNSDDIRIERKVKKNLRTGKDHTQGTIPTCVWEKNNHTTSKDHCGWHPTTKNLEILQRMIKAYSNENDTILDIFMGSGSTAIACKLTNRNYIGCESNNNYIKLMQERIDSYATLSTVTQFLK